MAEKDPIYTIIQVDVKLGGGEDSLILVPLDGYSADVLQQIIDRAETAMWWRSRGNRYADPHTKEHLISAKIACGDGLADNLKIQLDLEAATDVAATMRLSQYLYFGGAIVSLADATASEFRILFGAPCKMCGGLLRKHLEMEWRVCDWCADHDCEHTYTEGLGQTDGHPVHMTFCKNCGRPHPDWKSSGSPMQDMLEVVAAGDVQVLGIQHPDGSSTVISKKQ